MFTLLLLLPGAFEFNLTGGGAMQAGVAAYRSEASTSLNPALLSGLEASRVTLSVCQPFALPGLYYNQADLVLRRPAVGVRFSALTIPGYQEFQVSAAKGFTIADRVDFGAAADACVLAVEEQPVEVAPGLAIGAAWRSRYVSLGAAFHNFNLPSLGSGGRLPLQVLVGTCVTPYPNLGLAADFEYADAARLRFGAGFDLAPYANLALGLSTNPLLVSGGFRVSTHGLSLAYTYAFQPRLKQTHIIGLGYSF